MLKKVVGTIGICAIALTTSLAISKKADAKTYATGDIAVNAIRLDTYTGSTKPRRAYFEVPDSNTAVSAYGDRMTLSDVHIARMIALTHNYHCTSIYTRGVENVMIWNYAADSGRLSKGQVRLRCSVVEWAVKTYGLGRKVPMAIKVSNSPADVLTIPVLDIQGERETKSFIKFVRSLKPKS
ncbi:hypothetical protein H6F77_06360 [Microcoleus sp. FACHB-831]|uniref:hypothetical protein n=1 Tax=Microcoleus sp. FACHB-831 TaxID=2692827 RepID=UPI00168A29D7|nr:hypothetical protein [Microcoleus sp. FACHB-831]MBD1920705.1 hypothetical protein [Microcoleus sp. FACHB-831]